MTVPIPADVYYKPENIAERRRQMALRPECPDWCLPQWCAIRPVTAGGEVWSWTGMHLGGMRVVDFHYGTTAQVAAGAPEDDPDSLCVHLQIADRECAVEPSRSELTLEEAEALANGLLESVRQIRLMRGEDAR